MADQVSNYEDLIQGQWDEIPTSKLWPKGSYLIEAVANPKVQSFTGKDGKDYKKLLFSYRYVEPMADVSEEALAEMGDYDFSEDALHVDLWANGKRDYDAIRLHLAAHGFEFDADTGAEAEGRSIQEVLGMVKGRRTVGLIGPRTYQDRDGKTKTVNNIFGFANPED
jgi:hypothetical protein